MLAQRFGLPDQVQQERLGILKVFLADSFLNDLTAVVVDFLGLNVDSAF